ncbi:MAG TPA: hypothetical protein VFH64_13530 [Amnibacterium sp.]|nr:hypothetical protein [Amnibacterium sp.]
MTLSPADDLRHRPEPGGRMRDSLFWQVVLPHEELAVQLYLTVTGSGRAGYQASVWGGRPLAVERGSGRLDDGDDFADLRLDGLTVQHGEPLRSATVALRGGQVELDLAFEGLHDAFSYHENPDGLPAWFATDRMEQTGRVAGVLRFGSREVRLDGLGHRDHSWGLRDWRLPQHWKWFVASTGSGRAVNGWIWVARGEWGFAGYVLRDGRPVPVSTIDSRATYGEALEQRSLVAVLHDVEGGATRVELDVFGVLELPDGRSRTVVMEGACRARIDGEAGSGQFEAEWPAEYLEQFRTR